jgi:hypothetical protein
MRDANRMKFERAGMGGRALSSTRDRKMGTGMMAVAAGVVFAAVACTGLAQAQTSASGQASTQAQTNGLPAPQTANGIQYVSGGFGDGAAEAFRRAQSEYPLSLTFAAGDEGGGARPYVADVRVVIRDKSGNVVIDVPSAGPHFLARLEPGRYTVEATYEGQAQSRDITVKQGGSTQEVLTWKRS